MNNKKSIGTGVITYDEHGEVVSVTFLPNKEVSFDKTKFRKLNSPDDTDTARENAELALAEYFNYITGIELADREKVTVKSEIANCLMNGERIGSCEVNYFVEEN